MEYKDRLWMFFEFKYGNTALSPGQRLAFERKAHDLAKSKPTLFIIARHWQLSHEAIDCANAEVVEISEGGKFVRVPGGYTVKALADKFIREHEKSIEGDKPSVVAAAAPGLWLAKLDWRTGLRCGLSGGQCRFCRGVPCTGSTEWDQKVIPFGDLKALNNLALSRDSHKQEG